MQPHIQMFSIKSKQISSVPKSEHIPTLLCNSNASINVKLRGGGGGGTRAYVGHMTFQKSFWSKSPLWSPKIGSNQIKYPHHGEVISLKFIVVIVYILQIIDKHYQAFFL